MVSQNQMISHFLAFENLVWEEFGEVQAVNFLFKGLVKERMLIVFNLVFLFSNGRDFLAWYMRVYHALADFEKVISLFISLESFSLMNWRKLNILNVEISDLDLILVQQLLTLISFVCSLK